MRRVTTLGSAIVSLCLAAVSSGEQQVKLQSGATLVGEVSAEGSNLVVDVDGAKIPVALKDVASVAPATSAPAKDAKELLVRALEAQLSSGGENQELGLLKEAFRLAPEDPQIAFWYARSLANSGFGKGAHEVFEPRRAAILAAYPELADQLARQIAERVALEKLPGPLVKRLDDFAAAAKLPALPDSDSIVCAAYFQIVDQTGTPLDRSDFGIDSRGEQGELESFADGYYLYTYKRNTHFHNNPCQLEISRPGLVSKSLEFEGDAREAKNVGVVQVTRLAEADRRAVEFRVVNAAGEPLTGATITLNSASRYGNSRPLPALETNAEGIAETVLYPNSYYCQVSRRNFNPISQNFTVPLEGKETVHANAKLYPAIQATIQVEWQGKSNFPPGMPRGQGSSVTTGKFEQTIGPNGKSGSEIGRFGPPWVQLVQTEDELKIQFMDRMHFPQAEPAWVGRLRPDSDNSGDRKLAAEANAELFDVLALGELNALVQEFKIERKNLGGMGRPGGDVQLPIEAGDIYLGRINGNDPETGRPATIEFKLLATDVVQP